jgi:hypothetical protein
MKLFSIFQSQRSSELQAFAQSLANDITKRYPPALDNSDGKFTSVNRLTRIIEETCQRVTEYQSTHKLGWIGKSRLANAFQWELKDKGYTKKFVEFATEAVVVHLSK